MAEVAQRRKVPVIALTLPFHCWPKNGIRKQAKPGRNQSPPVVHCKNSDATKTLGRIAGAILSRNGVESKVNALAIPGSRRRIDSIARINGFRQGLIDAGVDLLGDAITRTEDGEWRRLNARNIMQKAIEESNIPIHVVFAANDEMALGVRDAILAALKKKKTRTIIENTIVFGFDAIGEATSLIVNDCDPWLKGTVEQQVPEMADALAEVIHKVRSHQEVSDVEILPKCIYDSSNGAAVHVIVAEMYPHNVPALDTMPGGDWMTASEVAKVPMPSKDSLARYRRAGKTTDDKFGRVGQDKHGRIFRIDGEQGNKVYYLRSSVLAVESRRRNPT